MSKKVDLTGLTFNRLTVVREVSPKILPSGGKDRRWLCKCSCGNYKEVSGNHLKSERTKSCGCLRQEKIKKHGMSHTSEYGIWESIKHRCLNVKNKRYKDYGGRGIKICDRWLNSFENFYKDMGSRPNKDYSIERLDNNQGYTPDNCIWVERSKQARNQRMQSNNTSGVTGVSFDAPRNLWCASWYDLETGKRMAKSFTVREYGYEEAFRLACAYRENMILHLNEQGAGYSENHGLTPTF